MGCPACGAGNPVAAKFCQECGSPQPRHCSACGHDVGATARFCPECGERLGDATTRRQAPAEPAVPQAYTPRHLAEKILAGRAALAGEHKQVTVLFADVVGSTELIRDLDPEDAQRLLDGLVARMMDAVHRFEGTVSRAMGDGIMALFGAPLAHEDHAARACYAALAMLEAVRDHAEEVRRTHGAATQIRVGLNSGEVVVRLISDDLHMDYTALGQTVHLASRMEGLANAGTALLSPATLKLVDGLVETRSLGAVEVKGLERPLPVYELVGPGAARTRLRAAAARGLTPFVGRDDEEATLSRALERARGGQAQVVALVGEPGVGKSRMAWEIAHSPRTADWLVLESECVSHGSASPYLPIVGLLRRYFGVEAADDAHAIRGKVSGKLLTLDRALEPCLSPLLALLDVPIEDGDWQRLDPSQRRRQTHEAVKWALLREGRERPLLVVFEDLHWIDAETQALLDDLVGSLPTARIVLLVTYRPEYAHEWGRKTYYGQIRVDPLHETSARALLASLLGDDPSVESLNEMLVTWTEGNPLFLEESVRALVELQVLAGERGAYRLPGAAAGLPIPSTVHAVLASRIDRLSAADKALLQAAAVVGRDVPASVLRAIAGREEDDLQRGMAALQAAEFVYEARLFPELEYTFKHALTHDVAYDTLLQERRRTLHRQVVGAIESIYADRLDEHTELLAYHASRAEAWEKAAAYAHRAAPGRRSLGEPHGHLVLRRGARRAGPRPGFPGGPAARYRRAAGAARRAPPARGNRAAPRPASGRPRAGGVARRRCSARVVPLLEIQSRMANRSLCGGDRGRRPRARPERGSG